MAADHARDQSLAAMRARWEEGTDTKGINQDHARLLAIAERAAALLEALRAESVEAFEHDLDARRVTQQIWTWVNGYPDFDARPLYDALTALAEALCSEP
jgi:flagellar biosynthesis regulator FlaF